MPRAASLILGRSLGALASLRILAHTDCPAHACPPARRAALPDRIPRSGQPYSGVTGALRRPGPRGGRRRPRGPASWCAGVAPTRPPPTGSGDRDLVAQVDVLDGADQGGPLGHRSLEGLAADDETHAAGALVDDRGAHGL